MKCAFCLLLWKKHCAIHLKATISYTLKELFDQSNWFSAKSLVFYFFSFSTRGLILTLFIFTQKHVLFAYFVCLLKQLEKNSGKNCSFWFFEEKKLFKIIVCLHNTRKSVKKLPNDCRKLCLLLCFCCSYVFFVRSFLCIMEFI